MFFIFCKITSSLENQIDCIVKVRLRLAVDHLIWCIDFLLHDRIQPSHSFLGEQLIERWKHLSIFLIGLNEKIPLHVSTELTDDVLFL